MMRPLFFDRLSGPSIRNFLNSILVEQQPALQEYMKEVYKLYFFAEKGKGASGDLLGQANNGNREPDVQAWYMVAPCQRWD